MLIIFKAHANALNHVTDFLVVVIGRRTLWKLLINVGRQKFMIFIVVAVNVCILDMLLFSWLLTSPFRVYQDTLSAITRHIVAVDNMYATSAMT